MAKSAFVINSTTRPSRCQRDIGVLGGLRLHAGQGAASRPEVIATGRYEEKARLPSPAATMSSIRPGDPSTPPDVCGPLISARQRDRVHGATSTGGRRRRKVHIGGARPAVDFYIEPRSSQG